jgi:hypothetical protein
MFGFDPRVGVGSPSRGVGEKEIDIPPQLFQLKPQQKGIVPIVPRADEDQSGGGLG